MPPQSKNTSLDNCWDVHLPHINGEGQFCLYDEHGKARCSFKGNEKASQDALALLNYLIGTNVPHPDPKMGVLAGIRATGDHYVMG